MGVLRSDSFSLLVISLPLLPAECACATQLAAARGSSAFATIKRPGTMLVTAVQHAVRTEPPPPPPPPTPQTPNLGMYRIFSVEGARSLVGPTKH